MSQITLPYVINTVNNISSLNANTKLVIAIAPPGQNTYFPGQTLTLEIDNPQSNDVLTWSVGSTVAGIFTVTANT